MERRAHNAAICRWADEREEAPLVVDRCNIRSLLMSRSHLSRHLRVEIIFRFRVFVVGRQAGNAGKQTDIYQTVTCQLGNGEIE
jgi:hypothetical protein